MTALIEIRDLSKHYRSVVALDCINLKIDNHSTIGLVGKNGAGKTTLLSILSGTIRPNSGTVKVLGQSPHSSTIKGKISILLQEANFKKGIPVITQLEHFARLQGLSKQAAKEEIGDLLKKLNNTDYAHKKPETLSFGQRKRMGIVQAFIGSPDLVLLDEPTAGLDPVAANSVRSFLQAFSKQSAFIISSHNLYEIEDICSTIVVLDKGKIVTNANLSDLTNKNNSLNITLDQAISAPLMSAISGLEDVTELIVDDSNQEKITVHIIATELDKFQLSLQTLIVEHGYSVIQLSRGKALIDEVIKMVDAES